MKILHFLSKSFQFETSLTLNEFTNLLSKDVIPPSPFASLSFQKSNKKFEGKINKDRFIIRRTGFFLYPSFLKPHIIGVFKASNTSNKIDIEVTYSTLLKMQYLLWLFAMFLFLIMIFNEIITYFSWDTLLTLILMLSFNYLLYREYLSEVNYAVKYFNSITYHEDAN